MRVLNRDLGQHGPCGGGKLAGDVSVIVSGERDQSSVVHEGASCGLHCERGGRDMG